MKKRKKPQQFIQKPTYDGGPKAMNEFISRSLKYPPEALEAKMEGTVRLRMRINYKGAVEHVQIITSLGYGCDEEASRVAKLLKFKVPTNRGIKAHFHKTLNFHFRLPSPKAEENVQQLQYTMTKSNPYQGQQAQEVSKNYSYTIEIN